MKFVNKNNFELEAHAITPETGLEKRRQPNAPLFIDVRSSQEYHKGHLAGATLLPAEFIEDHLMQLPPFAHIIIYGETEEEAGLAVQTLSENGFSELSYIPGGYPAILAALRADENEILLDDLPKEEWPAKIDEVLTAKVRPALAQDGGGLEVVKIQEDQVFINYQGACSGCASSTTGTLKFIEGTLRTALNHDIEVITT